MSLQLQMSEAIQIMLPDEWAEDLQHEALVRISNAKFARRIYDGNGRECAKQLVIHWPFVKRFWRTVEKMEQRYHGAITYELSQALREVVNDEASHAALWQLTATELGVNLERKDDNPLVQNYIEYLEQDCSLQEALLKLYGVEIFAWGISYVFMQSEKFRALVGEKGGRWFQAHLDGHHRPLILGAALSCGPIDKAVARMMVLGVGQHYMIAAESEAAW